MGLGKQLNDVPEVNGCDMGILKGDGLCCVDIDCGTGDGWY